MASKVAKLMNCAMSHVDDGQKELGKLCPTLQFVALHRGHFSFYGHVPLIEDWTQCSAVRTVFGTSS